MSDEMPTKTQIQVSTLTCNLLLLIPLFATSNPTSYSDINGRTRLAARHYGVPRAKTSRKMLEFMPAFAHLPPHPFSRFLWTLASLPASPLIPHPLISLFSLSVWPFYVKLNPTTAAMELLLFARVRKLFAATPLFHVALPFPLNYLLLSAIEHRVPLRDPRYPVR